MRPHSMSQLRQVILLLASLFAAGMDAGQWSAVEWDQNMQGVVQDTGKAAFAVPDASRRILKEAGHAAGRVVGWGTLQLPNYVPPSVLQQGATQVAIIDADFSNSGQNIFLALLSNHSVVRWGGLTGEVSIPANATAHVVAIAAGFQAAMVLLSNGTVVPLNDVYAPIPIPRAARSGVTAIWAGADLYFARLQNGSLVTWNLQVLAYSRQGNGAFAASDVRSTVVTITHPTSSSSRVVGVAGGNCGDVSSSCWMTLRANGSVIPGHGVSVVPKVLQLNVIAIASSSAQASSQVFLALLSNGSIVQWSYACPHKLDAVLFPLSRARQRFTSIAAPSWAVTAAGAVASWDPDSLKDTSDSLPISVQYNVHSVVGGSRMSLALQQPGPVNVVGFNGEASAPARDSIPAEVSVAVITQVAAGANHAIALQTDGSIVVWGDSSKGQLSVPLAVVEAGMRQVAAAEDFCMVVTQQGDLYAWGGQSPGAPPSSLTAIPAAARSNVAKVVAGSSCSLAVLKNGSVVVWGDSGAYRLQHIINAARAQVADIAVDAYDHRGCTGAIAVLRNGSIVEWGETNTTPKLNNVVSVAMSTDWAAAVLRNGSLVFWQRTAHPSPTPASQTFTHGLKVQRVVLDNYQRRFAKSLDTAGLVLLRNGTLIPVTFTCNKECGNIIPHDEAQSGVIDMAVGGAFYLAVTTNSISPARASVSLPTVQENTKPHGLSSRNRVKAPGT